MAKQTVNLGTSANKGDGDPLRTAFDKVNDNFTEVYSLLGAEGGDVDDVVAPMLVHSDHTNVSVTRDDAANKIIFSVDPYDGDITGSVFGDDSTLLVDGVNGKIVGPVENNFAYINTIVPVPGSLGNISITADPGELAGGSINIVAGRGLGDSNGGQVTIDAGTITDNGTKGDVNLGTSSSQTGAVYIGYPIASHIVVSNDLNRITLNGDVDFTNATVTGLTLDGDVTGSVFGDDSTLLVDGVNGVIPYPANAGVVWDGTAPATVDAALDRLASYTQDFAVSTDAHWADPNPTGTTDAINRLAAAIYALNGNTGI